MIVFDKFSEDELKKFLIDEKGFGEGRVLTGIEKLKGLQGRKSQSRLESFFKTSHIITSKVKN